MTLFDYLTSVHRLTPSEIDRGVPYSDMTGATPVLKTQDVGEHDGVFLPQELEREAIAIAERDFVETAWRWFQSKSPATPFVTPTVQAIRPLGLVVEWLPDDGRPETRHDIAMLSRTLQEIDRLRAAAASVHLAPDEPAARVTIACGLLKFHQRLDITFRNVPAAPVSAADVRPGQKLECVSYGGLYYGAALLAGLSPRWMEAIWPNVENTHLYVAVPLEAQSQSLMMYVDLMTETCGLENPFPEATHRELTPLEVLAGYAVARKGKGIDQLQKALHYAPNDYQAHYTSGFWYAEQGQAMAARHHWERAIALYPTLPFVTEIQSELKKLSRFQR